MKSVFPLCVLLFLVVSMGRVQAQVHEFDLPNGIHVIVNHMEQAKDVGVETVYEVGFIDEPKSMVQSSHLLEHLVCYAPGAGFKAKEAMAWLNKTGFANAETMPDFTHYDYASAAENLEKILEIEAARIQQAEFERAMIAFEAKRVYMETDFVENNPQAGMLKHAFMALSHAWKFQSKSALVRGGLENMDAKKILGFYQSAYVPQNLTIGISGNAPIEMVKPLIEKHFGNLRKSEKVIDQVDWSSVPQNQTIGWDSKHRAVCVSWSPPADKKGQVLVSLLSTLAMQKIANDPTLKKQVEMIFCTNQLWMAGDLPVFVYAMLKPDQDVAQVEQAISGAFKKEIELAASDKVMMLKHFALQQSNQRKASNWAMMEQSSRMLQNMGRAKERTMQMVLAQDALTKTTIHRLLGNEPEKVLEYIKNVEQDELLSLVEKTMRDENRRVVRIVPMKK